MKLRNKIIIVLSCVALLVSLFCVSSFAYVNIDDNLYNMFPSASFVTYNSNGTVNSSSCTVRASSVNTGNSSSTVRSVWSRSSVNDSINVSLSFGTYNISSLAITDFYYPIYSAGDQGDINIDVGNFESVSGSYGEGRQIPYESIYIKIGFYYFDIDNEPVYYEVESNIYELSYDTLSVYRLINFSYGFNSNTYCLVNYIYIAGSNLFKYGEDDYTSQKGAFAGVIKFVDTYSSFLGVDSNLNIQYGNDILEYGSFSYGSSLGYNDGYSDGVNDGIGVGYEDGYNEGLEAGEDIGYSSGFDVGYSDGYSDGSEDTYGSAYQTGFDKGYNDGLKDGEELASPENWFDGIIRAVSGVINTPLFGSFSFGDLFYVILGFSLFMWILKIFGGG